MYEYLKHSCIKLFTWNKKKKCTWPTSGEPLHLNKVIILSTDEYRSINDVLDVFSSYVHLLDRKTTIYMYIAVDISKYFVKLLRGIESNMKNLFAFLESKHLIVILL